MTYRGAVDAFLNDRDWAFEVNPSALDVMGTRLAGSAEERIIIDVPGGPYELSFRTFNLLTVAAHDYTTLLAFFAREFPEEWNDHPVHTLDLDDWRARDVEETLDADPILTRTGMNALAHFWWTVEQPYHNHPSRHYVRPHMECIKENHGLFHNLEIGPMYPGLETVYRGTGDPIRVVPSR